MLYWMVEKTNQPLTMKQLEHAVMRNFGGLEDEEVDAVAIFKQHINITEEEEVNDDPLVSILCAVISLYNIAGNF